MDKEEKTFQDTECQTTLQNIYLKLTFEPVWKREKHHREVQTDILQNRWEKYEMSWCKYKTLKKAVKKENNSQTELSSDASDISFAYEKDKRRIGEGYERKLMI